MPGDILTIISLPSFEEFSELTRIYQYLMAVLVPLIFGEIFIYFFSVSYGLSNISIFVFAVALASILLYDYFLYKISNHLRNKHNVLERLDKIKPLRKVDFFFKKCERRYSRFPFILLLIIKILPATKVTVFFFTLRFKMTLLEFMLKNSLATFVWMLLIFIPGFLFGKGIINYINLGKINTFLIIAVALSLISFFFLKDVGKLMMYLVNKYKSFIKNRL